MNTQTDSAFPLERTKYTDGGLTKREYFAAKALQGILAAQTETVYLSPFSVAEKAIIQADALIEQLNQNHERNI